MKNVILLTIDTLRKDVLGCYGHPMELSPFIDSLCGRAVRFTNLHATGPYTQASFPAILTGSYYLDFGLSKTLSPQRTLLSEALKKAGVATAALHSNPYLSEFFGWNRGWDTFYDSMEAEVSPEVPYIKGDGINAKVDQWLAAHATGPDCRPFFLWAHYMDIHEPYCPAARHVQQVDPSIKLSQAEMFALFQNVLLKRDASDPATVELLRKLYLAHVPEVDEYVRSFFDILAKRGVLDDSVVLITADHGDEFGEHGSLSHDGKFYRELIEVPLLIVEPGRKEPAVCDKLASTIDIPATVLHLFGLAPEPAFQGRSLLPAADYPDDATVFGEAIGKHGKAKETDKPVYYARRGDMKIVYREEGERWELYDLSADPAERNNVIDSSPRAEEMKAVLQPRIGRN